MKDILNGIYRHIVTSAGTAAALKSFLADDALATGASAIVVIISLAQSVVDKIEHRLVMARAVTASLSETEHHQVMAQTEARSAQLFDTRLAAEKATQERGPTMPITGIALALMLPLLAGCAEFKWGRGGLRLKPVTPPKDAVVRVTVRNIGIHAGQNQATQTPELNIGYQSVTYDRVPTSTNPIYAAPMRASIDVAGGLTVGVNERLEVGVFAATNEAAGDRTLSRVAPQIADRPATEPARPQPPRPIAAATTITNNVSDARLRDELRNALTNAPANTLTNKGASRK